MNASTSSGRRDAVALPRREGRMERYSDMAVETRWVSGVGSRRERDAHCSLPVGADQAPPRFAFGGVVSAAHHDLRRVKMPPPCAARRILPPLLFAHLLAKRSRSRNSASSTGRARAPFPRSRDARDQVLLGGLVEGGRRLAGEDGSTGTGCRVGISAVRARRATAGCAKAARGTRSDDAARPSGMVSRGGHHAPGRPAERTRRRQSPWPVSNRLRQR
jgi:hypothetical protein